MFFVRFGAYNHSMLKRKKPVPVKKRAGIIDLLINADNKALPYLQAALLIYAIMLTIPPLIIDTHSDVDYSAYIGWHKAAEQGLIYGRDIVFTYGPLGFLTAPIFINKTLWAYSALYTLAVYAMVLFGFSLFLRKMKANLVKTVIFAVIFVAVFRGLLNWRPTRDFELLFSLLVFSYLYIRGKGNLIWLLGLAFLCGVLPYIKFSSIFAGGFIGAVFTYILIRDKRRKEAAVFLITSFVSFCILGLLLIGPSKAIFTYLYSSWQITSGYNDALGNVDPGREMDYFSAILAWIFYILIFGYCALRKRRDDIIYLVLCFGMLFLSFKLGFVRRDYEHVIYFYSTWLAVFGLFFLRPFPDAKIIRYFVLLFIFVMLFQCRTDRASLEISSFPGLYAPGKVGDKLKNLRLSFNLLRGIGTDELIAKTKTQLAKYFPLKDETVKMLSGHTVDVFPCDVAITEAYGFKWDPRPVFQSYLAYTEYLDSLNAKHFLSESAPEYILYALRTIDLRYAIFDEPATFRTLLQKYKPCAVDGEFIVLQKKPSADTVTGKYLDTTTEKFDQVFLPPQVDNGLLFAEVHIEQSLLGMAWKFLYKSRNVWIFLDNGQEAVAEKPRRLVYPNASNGLFIHQYIADQNDLLQIWNGNTRQNIRAILLWTPYPPFYKDKITVKFFAIPLIK